MSAPTCPYTFVWPYEATEVFVTGSFDKWSKSTQLTKESGSWRAVVDLPADQKVLYKFVADDEWKIDTEAATESDETGNLNNVITVEALADSAAAAKKRAKNKKKKASQKNKKKSAVGAANEDAEDFSRESTPGPADEDEEEEEGEQQKQKEVIAIADKPLGELAPAVEEPVVVAPVVAPVVAAVEEPVSSTKEPVSDLVAEVQEPVLVQKPVTEEATLPEVSKFEESVNEALQLNQPETLVATEAPVAESAKEVAAPVVATPVVVAPVVVAPVVAATEVVVPVTTEVEPITADDQHIIDAKEAVRIASRSALEEEVPETPEEATETTGEATKAAEPVPATAATPASPSAPAAKASKPKKKGFFSKLKSIFK